MKLRTLLLTMSACVFAINSNAQIAFGISPMIGLNTAYFGYNINNQLVPFIGLQSFRASGSFTEEGEEYDNNQNAIVDYENTADVKISVIVPTLGVKYFFNPSSLRPYVVVAVSKPLISGKLDVDDNDVEDAFDDVIENIKIFQTELAFGAEYFVANSFSVGGEFGLRILQGNFENSYDTEVYNPMTNEYKDSEVTTMYRAGFMPTYTKVYLNFYFGAGDN